MIKMFVKILERVEKIIKESKSTKIALKKVRELDRNEKDRIKSIMVW